MGSGEPQWPATVEGRRTHSQTYVFKITIGANCRSCIIFGCWRSHLDIGPVIHSKAHWTYTLVPESLPKYTPCCRRRWLWLRTQSAFQSCCHLVESQGPHRRWLKWVNNIYCKHPNGKIQLKLFIWVLFENGFVILFCFFIYFVLVKRFVPV